MAKPGSFSMAIGFAAALGALAGAGHVRAADPLLERAAAGQRAARQAVSTFSCEVLIETELPTKGVLCEGSYWRRGGDARVRQGKEGAATDDYLLSPRLGEIRQVGRSDWRDGRPRYHKAVRSPLVDFFCVADVWREMLILMPGPDGGQFDYDRVLELSAVTAPARAARLDGRECVVVSLAHRNEAGAEAHLKVYHEVGYNYLISKLEATYAKTNQTGTVTNSEFREFRPGVYFPTRSRRENYTDGKLTNVRVTTLSQVAVNAPIGDAVFALPPIPNGTPLQDNVLGREVRVNSDWRPVGGPTASVARAAIASASEVPAADGRPSSTSEPTPGSRWVLRAAAAGLLGAAALALVRRFRPAARPADSTTRS